jgi:hypothetical protein
MRIVARNANYPASLTASDEPVTKNTWFTGTSSLSAT